MANMKNKALHLRGYIESVKYDPRVRSKLLPRFTLDEFEIKINRRIPSGVIDFDEEVSLPYSKWLSPKPSRSYASGRVYRTYHMNKPIVVIPVLKDEGSGSRNNDRFTSTSLARMNLMGVYIVLAWYESARVNDRYDNRVKDHRLNVDWVVERIREIKPYRLSAHHWNQMHFKRDYESVYRQAVECYQRIGAECGVIMNSAENHLKLLEMCLVDGRFDLDAFIRSSDPRSARSARGEAMTLHDLEHLTDGRKAYLELKNFLGGSYHLTADEVFWEGDSLVIQESKNSRDALPKMSDVQDGLFKNILFMSIQELLLGDRPIQFKTRLKLTGVLKDSLMLPTRDDAAVTAFADRNNLKSDELELLRLLHVETIANPGLSIEIAPNS